MAREALLRAIPRQRVNVACTEHMPPIEVQISVIARNVVRVLRGTEIVARSTQRMRPGVVDDHLRIRAELALQLNLKAVVVRAVDGFELVDCVPALERTD